MTKSTISNIILEQRVRNNIIEYFELYSNEKKLIKFQNDVPIAVVPNELISSWHDDFWLSAYDKGSYSFPVFSEEERKTLLVYNNLIDEIYGEIPNDICDINDVFKLPFWSKLKREAEIALSIFMKRGLFSDDIEMKKVTKRIY